LKIYNYVQDDLDNDDVMLLDSYESVFVWVGKNSTDREKNMAKQVATDYIRQADDGRSLDSPVYIVEAGAEPLQFTVFFKAWDDEVAKSGEDLYTRKLHQLHLENSVVGGMSPTAQVERHGDDGMPVKTQNLPIETGGAIHPYSILRSKGRPEGLNQDFLEAYLNDEEFASVLKMGREEYYLMPKWKQLRLKKSLGLF